MSTLSDHIAQQTGGRGCSPPGPSSLLQTYAATKPEGGHLPSLFTRTAALLIDCWLKKEETETQEERTHFGCCAQDLQPRRLQPEQQQCHAPPQKAKCSTPGYFEYPQLLRQSLALCLWPVSVVHHTRATAGLPSSLRPCTACAPAQLGPGICLAPAFCYLKCTSLHMSCYCRKDS
jgi:hypothetical protein